jgi:hypothetical protein
LATGLALSRLAAPGRATWHQRGTAPRRSARAGEICGILHERDIVAVLRIVFNMLALRGFLIARHEPLMTTLGMIETRGLIGAIEAADAMVKAANVV